MVSPPALYPGEPWTLGCLIPESPATLSPQNRLNASKGTTPAPFSQPSLLLSSPLCTGAAEGVFPFSPRPPAPAPGTLSPAQAEKPRPPPSRGMRAGGTGQHIQKEMNMQTVPEASRDPGAAQAPQAGRLGGAGRAVVRRRKADVSWTLDAAIGPARLAGLLPGLQVRVSGGQRRMPRDSLSARVSLTFVCSSTRVHAPPISALSLPLRRPGPGPHGGPLVSPHHSSQHHGLGAPAAPIAPPAPPSLLSLLTHPPTDPTVREGHPGEACRPWEFSLV